MSFSDIFSGWYTDAVEVFRVRPDGETTGLAVQERKRVGTFNCRIYNSQRNGLSTNETAGCVSGTDALAVSLDTDIREGDELYVVRGGALGHQNPSERYFAGRPMEYRDPVGGLPTGLQHKEIGLMLDRIVGDM